MTDLRNAVSAGPVFIVGMNGSGTTMLLDHLGQHPALYAYPLETYVLPYYIRSQGQFGDLDDDDNFLRLWDKMRSAYAFQQRNRKQPIPLPDDWRNSARSAAGIFDRIMCLFAAKEGKERWAEKTPMHVRHIGLLSREFPEARFIHMIRDGRDCAASNHRRWGRSPEGTIYRWKDVVNLGRAQGEAIGERYLELKYEELTASPVEFLREACAFLSLEWDERVLVTDRLRPEVSRYASKTIVRSTASRDQYFTARRLRSLERIAGRTLARFGYDTDYPESERRVTRAERLLWFVRDGGRIVLRDVRAKVTTRKRLPWRLLYGRWRSSIQSAIGSLFRG